MSVNKTNEYNWQKATRLDRLRFGGRLSPNVVALKEYLLSRWGGVNVGILNKRNQRGGTDLSTHYFGAAIDWRYPSRAIVLVVMKHLVANSKEFGIQMIVDYVGGTVWTAKRGWHKAQPNPHGMGQAWAKWIHVETTRTDWKNGSAFTARLKP